MVTIDLNVLVNGSQPKKKKRLTLSNIFHLLKLVLYKVRNLNINSLFPKQSKITC